MNPYIEKLNAYFLENPKRFKKTDPESVLDLLCYIYTSENPVDNATIQYQFMQMDQILEKLPVSENDKIFLLACDLCTQHAQQAFIAGIHVGVRLDAELAVPEV